MIRPRRTTAQLGADLLAIVLLGAALVARRPEAVILAAPFLSYAMMSHARRPRPANAPEVHIDESVTGVVADAQDLHGSGLELVTIGWPHQPGLKLEEPSRIHTDVADRPAVAQYVTSRYGVTDLGPLTWSAMDALGAWRSSEQIRGMTVTVRPPVPGRQAAGPLTAPIGTLGPHRSPQPGPGTSLADVRLHQSGDERRRINWRVTARARALHTNTTDRERDTDIILVADTRYGLSAGRSSLDLTADALAALTQQYASQGDRVSLVDTSGRLRTIPPGTGVRQARRVVQALSSMQRARRPGYIRRPWPRIKPNAVVVVCSPLLTDELFEPLGALAARGCQCVVIDTLPTGIDGLDTALLQVEERRMALRLRRLLREPMLTRLGAAGIPVLPWTGPATLRAVSAALAQRPAGMRRR